MRKKNICLNLATGLLLLSSLTACGVNESDINIPFVKSDSVEKSEEKEDEVIVNKNNLSGSFGESEEIKTDSMDVNVEVEKEPEEDILELEDNETVETESVAESNIENPFEEYGKKLVGVHQFDMFKGEIPSYLYYYGISKMSSNGIEMPMSIFLKPDFLSSKELITVYNMDLGNQGLNEAGITINFSGLSDDMLNQYISSFGFEKMAPGEIISQKYVRYGDLAYLMIVYEDDGLYGTMGLTIENNLALFVMSASELSSDSSFKMFDDFLNCIEFNFESVEDELNYEAIDLELLLSSDSEKSLEEDSKDNKNINLDNVMTYSMNGYDITLDK